MLLRLVISNFASFKDPVEFNTFPTSRSQNHENHRVTCDHAEVLRMAAVYGANGSGKSNLVRSLDFVKQLVSKGHESILPLGENISFRLSHSCLSSPSGFSVEFFRKGSVYYYHIEIDAQGVLKEELYLSKSSADVLVFRRDEDGITLALEKSRRKTKDPFTALLERIVRRDVLLLSFLGRYYREEFPQVGESYDWMTGGFNVIMTEPESGETAHLMDVDPEFARLSNRLIKGLDTGIERLDVRKAVLQEEDAVSDPELSALVAKAKACPGTPVLRSVGGGDVANVVYQDHQVMVKRLVCFHRMADGGEVEMPLSFESDGIVRLMGYLPMIYRFLSREQVIVVDEMERSLHPLVVKALAVLLSQHENAKGQVIFTTHESALLDQDIFRPDEVWLCSKGEDQATRLMPLSDFNIHRTANIRNGYLDGRYGSIPTVGNLEDCL